MQYLCASIQCYAWLLGNLEFDYVNKEKVKVTHNFGTVQSNGQKTYAHVLTIGF